MVVHWSLTAWSCLLPRAVCYKMYALEGGLVGNVGLNDQMNFHENDGVTLKIVVLCSTVSSGSSCPPLFRCRLSKPCFWEQKGSSLRIVFEALYMWSDLLWGQDYPFEWGSPRQHPLCLKLV